MYKPFEETSGAGDLRSGWHYLQLPGPTNIPQRVLSAMHRPAIDHRGKAFPELSMALFEGMREVFKTEKEVFIYPSSGTGGWEAAISNTLSPGDKVLMFDSGMFSLLWIKMAKQFKLDVQIVENDWRRGPDPDEIETILREDTGHQIKGVFVVHNETATGVAARIPEIRRAIDNANHPALFFVDTISSLGSMEYKHDDWGVDVSVGGSQKGLMLPPGLGFNAVSEKARKAAETSEFPCCYFDWEWMRENNATGYFPYTPAIQMFYGLRESLAMLRAQGLDAVFARHTRLARATRAAVEAWGFETVCAEPREYSSSVTAVLLPEGHDADAFRNLVLDRHNLALGGGLARLAGKAFRIGHMGDSNDLMIAGALAGVEMGLQAMGIPIKASGAAAANAFFAMDNSADGFALAAE